MMKNPFIYFLIIWPSILPFLSYFGSRFPKICGGFDTLYILISIPISFIVLVFLFIIILLNILQKEWNKVLLNISILGIPILAFSIVAIITFSFDNIRLYLFKDYYLTKMGSYESSKDGEKLKAMGWGEQSYIGFNMFLTLVYDEQDELLKPKNEWSSEWKQRAPSGIRSPMGKSCKIHVNGLGNHFFLVSEICT